MTESNQVEKTIRVLPFTGKKKEWGPWEEKFLAKAKRSGYKDVLLGNKEIPKASDTVDEEGAKIKDLNELGYHDLMLCMDTDTVGGNVAFHLVKGTKSPDYPDGNIARA